MLYFIYDYFFPAFRAGGPIQSLYNLANAITNEMQVGVVCSNRDADGTFLKVPADEWSEYAGIKVYYSTGFRKFERQLKKKECIFFINGIYSLHYNLLPILFLKGRMIISTRGMLNSGALGQKRFKKQVYIKFLKLLRVHRKCEFHATNIEEKEHVQRVFGKKVRVWVIPNMPKAADKKPLPCKRQHALVMCTVALISPMKNHRIVLEALKTCTSEVVYHIYGPVKDQLYWNKCKKIISTLPPNISVTYFGEVQPELVRELIAKCHVYIQPSLSENFGHSLYESLALGRPVITSNKTPWLNLKDSKAGINVQVNDKEAILEAVSLFAGMNEHTMREWSTGARNYALSKIDSEEIRTGYLHMFRSDKYVNRTYSL